jgi:hypothetical protein
MGNNAGASANHGFSLLFDDRASASRNERAIALATRGGSDTTVNMTADLAHPPNTPVIITHIGDTGAAAAANRSILRINGVTIQNNTLTNAASSADATFALQLGTIGNNIIPLVGDLWELVILPFWTSLDTVQRVEGYLAGPVEGWNLQSILAAGHPFKSAPPMV